MSVKILMTFWLNFQDEEEVINNISYLKRRQVD